jgi:hypothetical protein
MPEERFLYGVYSIVVRSVELHGARWDAEYEIRHLDKAVQHWKLVGGDAGLTSAKEAIDMAHNQAVADIEAGAGIPKPHAFP